MQQLSGRSWRLPSNGPETSRFTLSPPPSPLKVGGQTPSGGQISQSKPPAAPLVHPRCAGASREPAGTGARAARGRRRAGRAARAAGPRGTRLRRLRGSLARGARGRQPPCPPGAARVQDAGLRAAEGEAEPQSDSAAFPAAEAPRGGGGGGAGRALSSGGGPGLCAAARGPWPSPRVPHRADPATHPGPWASFPGTALGAGPVCP